MLAVPAVIPDTMPLPEPIVATEVLSLVHAPPADASVKSDVVSAHSVLLPEIATGVGFTVTTVVAVHPVASV